MGEFELIRRYFVSVARQGGHPALLLGPGDDCAVQRIPAGDELVFSVDTMVEGVHFPRRYPADRLAWRALAAAASDLAAMGAEPVCFTLALTLPDAQPEWLADFSRGLAKASARMGLALAGGDTTRGPLTVTMQVHGTVPRDQMLLRSGARPGDLVVVSGTLGDAGAALEFLDGEHHEPFVRRLLARYHRPLPRLRLGQALRGIASAAIDVSDGLLADLGHVLKASGVGARLRVGEIPVSSALKACKGPAARDFALTAGDDYELCLTLPPGHWQSLSSDWKKALTVIGVVEEEAGLRLDEGRNAANPGYDHFGETP